MNLPVRILLSLFIITPALARVQEHEVEQARLSGYKEYIEENQAYERERLRSYRAYLESVEKDMFEKNKALHDFKRNKKIEQQESDEPDNYKDYLAEQKKDEKNADIALQEYKKNQRRSKLMEARRDFTEEEELGIFVERPRYDYKKRAMYGAKPKYKTAEKSISEGGGSAFPAVPDFATDSGYIPPPPPPPMNEPFYDEIPPPPPMPFPADYGDGDMGDGYIPPPPPPPPMFDGEF